MSALQALLVSTQAEICSVWIHLESNNNPQLAMQALWCCVMNVGLD